MAARVSWGPVIPEVVTDAEFDAHDAASYVKARWAAGKDATLAAYIAMLDIGEALNRAKAYWRTNQNYGEWFRLYEFPFSIRWGNELARAAKHREGMLRELEKQIGDGAPNFKAALRIVEGKTLPSGTQVPDATEQEPEPEQPAADVGPDLELISEPRDLMPPLTVGELEPELRRQLMERARSGRYWERDNALAMLGVPDDDEIGE